MIKLTMHVTTAGVGVSTFQRNVVWRREGQNLIRPPIERISSLHGRVYTLTAFPVIGEKAAFTRTGSTTVPVNEAPYIR